MKFRTISNVPASNAPEENNNNDKVLSELGFNVKGKGPVAEMTKSMVTFFPIF